MIALYLPALGVIVAVFVLWRRRSRLAHELEVMALVEQLQWSPERRYVTSGGWAMWLVETPEGVVIQGSNGQVQGNCRGEWLEADTYRASASQLEPPGDEWVLAVAEFMDYLEVAR